MRRDVRKSNAPDDSRSSGALLFLPTSRELVERGKGSAAPFHWGGKFVNILPVYVHIGPTDFVKLSERKVIMDMTGTAKTLAPEDRGIGIRAAVLAARKYMTEAHDVPLEDVQLEETELSDDDRTWLITLSYLRTEPPSNAMFATAASSLFQNKVRVYRTVTVDAQTGKAKSMKIRKV